MRALLSSYDKTGIVGLGRDLAALGWDLVATEGTARLLAADGLTVLSTTEWTGLPVMFDGRLKTLHHKVFAALLSRRDSAAHLAEQDATGVVPFDLIAGSFTPFARLAPGSPDDELPDLIDIGGPAMMRAAAKNHRWVLPLVDPGDYGPVTALLRAAGGDPAGVPDEVRRSLAAKAFRLLSDVDSAIASALVAG
ncbi:hypothetical protein [Lentzea kentuckyensis]|uniref:hypothetical protein n=1 Tax=Lentzea kentuckyensis TaxID=360086 RepID=UPI000A360F90|nr:hypothetical protein [Lentzea kentuckyensis]